MTLQLESAIRHVAIIEDTNSVIERESLVIHYG